MRFRWKIEHQINDGIDYDLHVTMEGHDDVFVGYVRHVRQHADLEYVRMWDCLSTGAISSNGEEFNSVRQAMRTLRTEIRIAIIGGATP